MCKILLRKLILKTKNWYSKSKEKRCRFGIFFPFYPRSVFILLNPSLIFLQTKQQVFLFHTESLQSHYNYMAAIIWVIVSTVSSSSSAITEMLFPLASFLLIKSFISSPFPRASGGSFDYLPSPAGLIPRRCIG